MGAKAAGDDTDVFGGCLAIIYVAGLFDDIASVGFGSAAAGRVAKTCMNNAHVFSVMKNWFF